MQNSPASCPICSSANVTHFTEKNNYQIYACNVCGFAFVYPLPSKQELAAIYSSEYFKNGGDADFGYTDYDKDKEPMRSVFELYLSKLETLVTGRNIFDVGAATGYFLDIAKKRGWKTFGSEISEYGVSTGNARGHQMSFGSLSDIKPDATINAITMWDVLEHVDDPRAYLVAAHEMLSGDGVIAINTVDRSSVWAKLMGARWHLIVPPEHLNYFSTESLSLILDQTGFEVLEIKKIGKSFSPAYVLKTLASWQGIQLWNMLAKLFDNRIGRMLSLPINLRDNVFVLARKKHV